MVSGRDKRTRSGIVTYSAEYRPREEHDEVAPVHYKNLGSYPTLRALCEEAAVPLTIDRSGTEAVEHLMRRRVPAGPLMPELGVYLGDVLCATLPDALWQATGDERPILTIGETRRWDVTAYVERAAGTRPDFLSAAVDHAVDWAGE